MIGDDDLQAEVFFRDEFATLVTRTRSGASDDLMAIIGSSDEEALDRRVVSPHRVMLVPASADLRKGDQVAVPTGPHAGTYRVQDARAINDGAEVKATVTKV